MREFFAGHDNIMSSTNCSALKQACTTIVTCVVNIVHVHVHVHVGVEASRTVLHTYTFF